MTDVDDQIIAALCGRVMELVRENEVLRALVCSMAYSVPAEMMPPDEAAMLVDTVERWAVRECD